ncbi:MAG: selenide, water dikinase SelD [Planctomycetota bacterium]
MKNMEKRRRVMRRSMQLGHCICDPHKPCPCDLFRDQDVCPCAGERLAEPVGPIRLTQLVESAGCASKINAVTLRRVLAGLPFSDDPRVLVGAPAGDDAGVYRMDDSTALVQTVDVFSPCVDDPYQFGRIAAANSLSDIYAMGARPLTALSIVGFPSHTLPESVLHQILRGGIDVMAEAGVAVLGGHSIQDKEIKAGFAVTGIVHPEKIVTNAGARPGDRLILTKPLGTGILAFAAQIGRAPPGSEEAAGNSMARLNGRASELMIELAAHACTDVTGFGLAGHLSAMGTASGVNMEIVLDDLPLLPGVLACLAEDIVPGAVERNRESSEHAIVVEGDVPRAMLEICFDPQTSGGLLIAVSEAAASTLLARLHGEGMVEAALIGKVLSPGTGRVFVRYESRVRLSQVSQLHQPSVIDDKPQEIPTMSCCSDHQASDKPDANPTGAVAETQRKFMDFLKSAAVPGALDARTKQAVAIALSVSAKCAPCAKIHIKKARNMGFSSEEIDEAVWMAIAFGGSPTMMWYNELKKEK